WSGRMNLARHGCPTTILLFSRTVTALASRPRPPVPPSPRRWMRLRLRQTRRRENNDASNEKSNHRDEGRAAEERDELAPLHSITSSASASIVGGISRPSAFAVFRLMIISNLVACITGRSAGFRL